MVPTGMLLLIAKTDAVQLSNQFKMNKILVGLLFVLLTVIHPNEERHPGILLAPAKAGEVPVAFHCGHFFNDSSERLKTSVGEVKAEVLKNNQAFLADAGIRENPTFIAIGICRANPNRDRYSVWMGGKTLFES